MTWIMPRLFVCEEFDDDNESMGWFLCSKHHPRAVEVVQKVASQRFSEIPPWVENAEVV